MSGPKRWSWLAGAVVVHAALFAFAAPRAAPAVIPVRVTTNVSFHVPGPSAPRVLPEAPRQTVAPAPLAETASSVPAETSAVSGGDLSDAGSGSGGDATIVSTYLASLRQAVADNKNYPYAARSRRQEGTVLLAFRLDGRGGLADEPQVVRSSGYPRLDAAAIEAVKVSSPFVPPPEDARPWEFRLPVEFVAR